VQIRSLLETGTDTERREKLLAVLNRDKERESAGVGLSEAEMCKIGLYPSLCSGALFFAPARTYVADSPSLGWGVGDMLQKLPRWIEV
jgi:hypothetical protein